MKKLSFCLLAVIVLSLAGLKTFGQCTNCELPNGLICTPVSDPCNVPIITNFGIVDACPGSFYSFTPAISAPGLTVTNWNIVPTTGVLTATSGTGSTVPLTKITVPTSCKAYSLTVNAVGPQLIEDGDFPWPTCCTNNLCFESKYLNGCCTDGRNENHEKSTNASGMFSACVTSGAIPVWGSHTTTDGTAALFVNANTGSVSAPIDYFWGQRVNLCPGATYQLSYSVRLWNVVTDPLALPHIETYIGMPGTTGHTLETGWGTVCTGCGSTEYWYDMWPAYLNPAGTAYAPGIGLSYLGTCNSSWQTHTVTFTYSSAEPSGTQFICMDIWNTPLHGINGDIAIDDITLNRVMTATESMVTVCPTPAPSAATITSPTVACVGSAVAFTVTGTPGDVVTYKVVNGSVTSGPYTGTIGVGGYFITPSFTISSLPTPATICLDITNISAGGTCNFPVTETQCVPIYSVPVTSAIVPEFVCVPPATSFSVTCTGTSGATYTWTILPGGTITGVGLGFAGGISTGQTINVNVPGPGTLILSCTASDPCGSAVTTTTVTVNQGPTPITGPTFICAGSVTQFSDGVPGGTWSSLVTSVATVGSATGVVTGDAVTATGSSVIYYTLPDGCYQQKGIEVDPLPAPITGPTQVCAGSTIKLSDATGGGVWSSSNPSVASIGLIGYIVTGGAVTTTQTVTITYHVLTGAQCSTDMIVTVNPLPAAITGIAVVCGGSTTILSDATPGGTWSSSNTFATVGLTTGVVTGGAVTAVQHAVITYTLPTGCDITTTVTVNPIPIITGPASASVCEGSTINLSTSVAGGSWTSSNTAVAVVGYTTGVVTGGVVTVATPVTITYVSPAGCTETYTVTVNPPPGDISGATTVCVGSDILLSDATTGGAWSSSNTHIATVVSDGSNDGVVTGVNTGIVNISYTSGLGCPTEYTVTVITLPIVDMGLPDTIYLGCPVTFWGTPGLSGYVTSVSWGISNTSIATLSTPTTTATQSFETITAITTGTVTVWYSVTNMCGTTTFPITTRVVPMPVVSIAPVGAFCAGSSVPMSVTVTGASVSGTGGGLWSSSNTLAAIVGSSSGVVTGVDPGGTSVITCTVPISSGACAVAETTTVTVTPAPTPITGITAICAIGGTTTLSDGESGGEWTSSNTGVATIMSDGDNDGVVTDVTTGTTVITYTIGGCSATATVSVIDNAPPCVCSYITTHPAFVINELEPVHTGTLTISPPITGGNYYLNHSIVINGAINMTNCVIVMSPSVSITVNNGAKLTITGSHLFCCPGHMWQGITLSTAPPGGGLPGPTGQLILTQTGTGTTTLIEDAVIAVYIPNPINIVGYNPAIAGTNKLTLYCDGATFNKDSIGIGIIGTPSAITPVGGPPTGEHPGYPYEIQNTVFTCRNFYGYPSGGGWPIAWPQNNGTAAMGALKAIVGTTTPYIAPYKVTTYPSTVCNNSLPSYCGIGLKNVGYTNLGTGPGTEVYSSVVAGSAFSLITDNTELNLYDNMIYGIAAQNSNVVSRNSGFMNMNDLTAGGSSKAIYSSRTAAAAVAGNLYQLDVYGNAMGYNNKFWNCITDVRAQDLYYVRGIYSQMSSEHSSATPLSLQGQYGYDVTVSDYYNVELNYNTIYNIRTGISSELLPPGAGAAQQIGQMSASYNTISANSTMTVATPNNEFMQTAIILEAAVGAVIGGGNWITGSEINADYNTIAYPYNGIVVENFDYDQQAKTSIGNNIHIVPDVTAIATGTAPYEQAGILHSDNVRSYIESNNIYGPGSGVPAPPSSYPAGIYTPSVTTTQTVLEGIHCANESYATVCGNLTENINTGVFFGGTETIQYWTGNTMQGNAYGYILDGVIGWQGGFGYPPDYVTGNRWVGAWTGTNYQTYTINTPALTDPTLSPMYVDNVPTVQVPINNVAEIPGVFSNTYSTGSSIFTATLTVSSPECTPPGSSTVPPAYMPVYKHAAQKQMPYLPTFVSNTNWISQMYTWRAIANDTTVDTNAVLHSFKLMAVNSRYKNLCDIKKNIAIGNYSAANTLLGNPIGYMASADSSTTTGAVLADSAGDAVVSNYRQYYQLLVKYMTDTLNSGDSLQVVAMANMCPFVDGSVIYNARALYHLVFNDGRLFSDVGCGAMGGIEARHSNTNDSSNNVTPALSKGEGVQQYTLSPNPNDGYMTLTQKVPDNNPVLAEVWNETGISIFNGQLHFEGGITNLKVINASQGMYLLQLIDSKGSRFILKFVIGE